MSPEGEQRRARTAVQHSEPGPRLVETLELVEAFSAVARSRGDVFRTIERLTDLRYGELEALTAVSAGADHHREVARRTGQVDAAAAATVEGLVRRGMLAPHHHPEAPDEYSEPTLVHLTPAGAVALQQAEALQVRLLDSALSTLGDEETERLREAVHHVGDRLERADGPRHPALLSSVADAS